MLKKLFALSVVALLMGACTYRPPLAEPPFRTTTNAAYMVFFDTDSTKLSESALETLRKAAAAYKESGGAKVTATGHTDTVGPPEYNKSLSLRRAQSVKDALVSMGVPADRISTLGKGEESPRVKTADGIAEPENRRVEISLQ